MWADSTNGAKPGEAVNPPDSAALLNTPPTMAIPSAPPLPPKLLSLIAATLTAQDRAREQDNSDNDSIDTDKPFDPGPIDPEEELDLFPPPADALAVFLGRLKGGLRDRWQECRREALKRGHLGGARARSLFCQPNQPAEWQPVQYEAVKELSKKGEDRECLKRDTGEETGEYLT